MSKVVYVVYQYESHEASRNVRAFATEEQAHAFIRDLKDYLANAPTIDDLGNSDAEMEEWSRQDERQRAYLKACPFDDELYAGNEYSVMGGLRWREWHRLN